MVTASLVAAVLLGAAGQVLFKAGLRPAATFLAGTATPPVLAGLACYALSTVLWLRVLREAPLGPAYGFLSLNFILVPLAARLFLGEPLPPRLMAGSLLIAAGILASHLP